MREERRSQLHTLLATKENTTVDAVMQWSEEEMQRQTADLIEVLNNNDEDTEPSAVLIHDDAWLMEHFLTRAEMIMEKTRAEMAATPIEEVRAAVLKARDKAITQNYCTAHDAMRVDLSAEAITAALAAGGSTE